MNNRKRTVGKLLKYFLYFVALMVLIQGVFIILVLAGTFGKLPDNQSLKQIQNPMATEVYTADGILMGTYYIQNRQFLEPGEIPANIKNALIATEDVRFYRHKGIDPGACSGYFSKPCSSVKSLLAVEVR